MVKSRKSRNMQGKYYSLATAQKALNVGKRTILWRKMAYVRPHIGPHENNGPPYSHGRYLRASLYSQLPACPASHAGGGGKVQHPNIPPPPKSTIRRTSFDGTDTARVCGKRMWRSTLG